MMWSMHFMNGGLCPGSLWAVLTVFTPLSPRGARVMWDVVTGRTKAYGFASFRSREDAQVAIDAMQGQVVGSRQIRCGWAQHKQVGCFCTDVLPGQVFPPCPHLAFQQHLLQQ